MDLWAAWGDSPRLEISFDSCTEMALSVEQAEGVAIALWPTMDVGWH